jgi:aspartyl-tRNA synthetase
MKYKAPRGTRDILPDEAAKWQYIEAKYREFCGLYGFGEIRTPIFEQTELFARSVGEESDIVSKEMYSFKDRSGRELTLRPELTASVARAYLEHNLGEKQQPIKLYYSGPMFRYDRPQAGRYRQFHQFGLEIFGAAHAAADCEIISFCYHFFKALNLQNLTIELNSVGCPVCRPVYRDVLVPYLDKLESNLCTDCRRRYKTNPMRVLDCKEESCQARVTDAPRMIDHLCAECDHHFSTLKELLNKLQIPFSLNTQLVRGLDYYTRTAFEITTGNLGAQASVCGGGRYDHLVEHLGGPPTPGVGVAFGKERILLTMDWEKEQCPPHKKIFIATAGKGFEGDALLLAQELRSQNIVTEADLLERSLKAQMKYAGKLGFDQVAILGESEIEKGMVSLRDMTGGEQLIMPRSELTAALDQSNHGDYQKTNEGFGPEVILPRPGHAVYKTHNCGSLTTNQIGTTVMLAGWVGRRRDHGGLIFIDLRDRSGLMQLVFDQQNGLELFDVAESLRSEYVVAVKGMVVRRSADTINPSLPTGEIEVHVEQIEILNLSKTPPFYIEDDLSVDENLRLRYRYLDLRRPEMFRRLQVRHRAVKLVRDYMDRYDFLEVETPMLTRSTPEGARDFLVPSRMHPGSFYALPQSPQLFKQLLMVSGIERYYQIVRCFRDEDLRADRQPEFTQIDIETSFFGPENLFALLEEMMALLWEKIRGEVLTLPFPKISYKDAMNRFGSDKPDLRFGMELIGLDLVAAKSDFKVFKTALEKGGSVKGLRVPRGSRMSRKDLDDLTILARQMGAKGLAWTFVEDGGWRSPIAKFFTPGLIIEINEQMEAQEGDVLLFIADRWELCCQVLGNLRRQLAPVNLPGKPNFIWVVDFPLFHYDSEQERYDSDHHPFTAPHPDDLNLLETEPLAVRAQAYDLVLNGVEIGGGSTRIHDQEIQQKIFKLLGFSEQESQDKFGFLLEALSYGAPPHGGLALGLDRVVALLVGDDSIRQVIPFPKTAAASCLMTGAPAMVDDSQLDDLKIDLRFDEDEENEE